jgi:hypothetical protein
MVSCSRAPLNEKTAVNIKLQDVMHTFKRAQNQIQFKVLGFFD